MPGSRPGMTTLGCFKDIRQPASNGLRAQPGEGLGRRLGLRGCGAPQRDGLPSASIDGDTTAGAFTGMADRMVPRVAGPRFHKPKLSARNWIWEDNRAAGTSAAKKGPQ